MKFKSKIRRRITIAMLSASVGIAVLVYLFAFTQVNHITTKTDQTHEALKDIAEETISSVQYDSTQTDLTYLISVGVEYINTELARIEKELTLLNKAISIQSAMDDPDSLSNITVLMQTLYDAEPFVSRITYGAKDGTTFRIPAKDRIQAYGVTESGWYQTAIQNPGTVCWGVATSNSEGDTLLPCALTFSGSDGKPAGVVTIGLNIGKLLDNRLKIVKGSDMACFVCNKDLQIIGGSGDIEKITADLITEMLSPATDSGYASSSNGITHLGTAGDYYYAYIPTGQEDWYFAAIIPKALFDAPVENMLSNCDSMMDEEHEALNEIITRDQISFNIIFALSILVVVLFSIHMSNRIRKPISILTETAREMGKGELNARVTTKGNDEIAVLGEALNSMAGDLQKYITEVSENAKEKERSHTELNVARDIQTGMLPREFPAFPDDPRFDIYASMRTAREVGGDFYDFFKPDPDHLVMVIADVSGKGIPAALFMVVARTLIKDQMRSGSSVATVLEEVNNQLIQNNGAEMFVTVWMGIADLNTGEIRCANAGHEYPMIRENNSGNFELYRDVHGLVLGGLEDSKYQEYTLTIRPGGCLLLYTDGVTDQQDESDNLFGIDKALATVNEVPDASVKEIIEHVEAVEDAYRGNAHQFDDMTLICWKRSATDIK